MDDTGDPETATYAYGDEEDEEMDAQHEGPAGAALPFVCTMPREDLLRRIAEGVPCESADEFLARARLEASMMPRVVRADAARVKEIEARVEALPRAQSLALLATRRQQGGRAETKAPPTAQWRAANLSTFRAARAHVEAWEERRFGQAEDAEAIEAFDAAHGIPAAAAAGVPDKTDAAAWAALVSSSEPLMSVVMELDQIGASRVLKDIVYAHRADPSKALPARTLRWLYALLTRIDLPLSVGMQSHLRDLLRVLGALTKSDDEDQLQAATDVVAYVVEDHFGCVL